MESGLRTANAVPRGPQDDSQSIGAAAARGAVEPDHYATLGVSPTAEEVVINAAYRALIRHYHPDRNSSGGAAERARAVNAAYAVIGDPERRAAYDSRRRGEGFEPPRRPPAGPVVAGSISAIAAGLLLFAILSPPAVPDESGALSKLPSAALAAAAGAEPTVPVEPNITPEPLPPSPSESAPAALTEPVDAPEPARVAAAESSPAAPPATPKLVPPLRSRQRPAVEQGAAAPATTAPAPQKVAASAAAKPSFDCPNASSRAERAVCRDSNLALLDGRMALQYSQSWGQANEAKRALLLETREGFVSRRDRCRSNSCISKAYLERMREISDIMGGNGQPR